MWFTRLKIVRGSETFFSIFSPLEDASKREDDDDDVVQATRCKPTADGSDMQEDDDGMTSLHSLTHSHRFEIQHRQYYLGPCAAYPLPPRRLIIGAS